MKKMKMKELENHTKNKNENSIRKLVWEMGMQNKKIGKFL